MRRLLAIGAILAISLWGVPAVMAEGEEGGGDEGGGEGGGEVAAPAPAPAAEPEKAEAAKPAAEEQEVILWERNKGFFFEGRGGMYLTLGGGRGYSNLQPIFGLELGYDVLDWLYIYGAYATGYQAANPLKQCATPSDPVCAGYHTDFSLTYGMAGLGFGFIDEGPLSVEARVGVGVAYISPSAEPNSHDDVNGSAYVGIRLKHYTLLKHFSLLLESGFYMTFPTIVAAISPLSLSVMYTF